MSDENLDDLSDEDFFYEICVMRLTGKGMTYETVGRCLAISHQRARQLEQAALLKLRYAMSNEIKESGGKIEAVERRKGVSKLRVKKVKLCDKIWSMVQEGKSDTEIITGLGTTPNYIRMVKKRFQTKT